jgi:putative transposase
VTQLFHRHNNQKGGLHLKIDVAYKFRIYPNKEQCIILAQTFGCCRFLWNQMLAERKKVYQRLKDDEQALHSYTYKTEKHYKQVFEFLKQPDAKALQNVTRNLFQAFQNFFEWAKGNRPRVGHPRFKSRKARQCYTTTNINNNIKIDFETKKLKLPKIDAWFAYRDDRRFDEKIRKVTVSKTKSGKYFVSLSFKREIKIVKQMEIHEATIEAFDMSFTSFMVSEHGRMENPRFYRRHQKRLKKLHRELSRKEKGSKNRDMARITLARYYEKIGNQRNDWLHKQALTLTRTYDAVILENLNIEAMKRFNKGFAKTVTLDFSWSEFVRMVDYKLERCGKHLVLVDRFYPSSKLCSNCGYQHDDLKLSDREWICPQCGAFHERDENSSKNLKREGTRILFQERQVTIINTATVGTTGSNASGDRVRPVTSRAVVAEGRIHRL